MNVEGRSRGGGVVEAESIILCAVPRYFYFPRSRFCRLIYFFFVSFIQCVVIKLLIIQFFFKYVFLLLKKLLSVFLYHLIFFTVS